MSSHCGLGIRVLLDTAAGPMSFQCGSGIKALPDTAAGPVPNRFQYLLSMQPWGEAGH